MTSSTFPFSWLVSEVNADETAPPRSNEGVEVVLTGPVYSAQRVGFFNIGSGRVGYWTKYRVAGRVRVG